jgi:TetR/AcrR family transcriptional regulator
MLFFADRSVGSKAKVGEAMKKGFFQLPDEKREKVVRACLAEFGAHDFEKAALDRIVEAAGISKGGLYEYISSKEELYLFVVELSYTRLYDYIHASLERDAKTEQPAVGLPADLLERFVVVSRTAIDFYVEHREMIGIIARTSHIDDGDLSEKVRAIFDEHFSSIFDSAVESGLAFPKERVVELLKWILVKTRNDFLREMSSGAAIPTVVTRYNEEWDFILEVLRRGVYEKSEL